MKFDDLCSIAHNFADSFGSGASLLFNSYGFYPYDDAERSADGILEIDFLRGAVISGIVSADMEKFVSMSPSVLADLCARHDASSGLFAELRTKYIKTAAGRAFEVTIVDHKGRSRTDRYDGIDGKRLDPKKHPPVTSL